ncbi:MAG: 5-(carboxyamino)imidazole ribonucleotide synthase [Bdellovibrionales bacterium]|nr:5-(carboxyamino)imidazole ribonucleotide synthase [Bdellovibrionales bacterium]
MIQVFPPGTTLGILGGGQLGKMFTIAAKTLGYRVCVFDSQADCPAGQVADEVIAASFEDTEAILKFASKVSAATLEFENLPLNTLKDLEKRIHLSPAADALEIAQDRLKEKNFFIKADVPTVQFKGIESEAQLNQAKNEMSFPAVIKTSRLGYDGKGQVKVQNASELLAAWEKIGRKNSILEAWIDFEKEISIVSARSADGKIVHFEPFENQHENHILDISISPAEISVEVAENARRIAAKILESLNYVGVLCVELFLTSDFKLLVNEIAPRPHNSGHLTIESTSCSQFEQQLRALCNLPLGSTKMRKPAAMLNLLGDLWSQSDPNFEDLLAEEETHLHLYGKLEARPGRKMGHITVLADTVVQAKNKALSFKTFLKK